jgi:hypothetical protein
VLKETPDFRLTDFLKIFVSLVYICKKSFREEKTWKRTYIMVTGEKCNPSLP